MASADGARNYSADEGVNARSDARRARLFSALGAAKTAVAGAVAGQALAPHRALADADAGAESAERDVAGDAGSDAAVAWLGTELQPAPSAAPLYVSEIESGGGGLMTDVVETVPVVKVVFQISLRVEFGESVRLIGGHECLGAWQAKDSLPMQWFPGDVWRTAEVELPTNAIFVYKYVVSQDAVPENVKLWQLGNNQALLLSVADQPLLHVIDNWRGDPGASYTCLGDGSNRQQPADRLTQVFSERETEVSTLRGHVSQLSKELQVSRLEVKALRAEARLSAKRRVDLQDALEVERARVQDLTTRVEAWQLAFGRVKDKVKARLGGGGASASSGDAGRTAEASAAPRAAPKAAPTQASAGDGPAGSR